MSNCNHPEHNPVHIVLAPGVYEHTCPKCGQKVKFSISAKHWQAKNDSLLWDQLTEKGEKLLFDRPMGPRKNGSKNCESGSIASGGDELYCTCDICF